MGLSFVSGAESCGASQLLRLWPACHRRFGRDLVWNPTVPAHSDKAAAEPPDLAHRLLPKSERPLPATGSTPRGNHGVLPLPLFTLALAPFPTDAISFLLPRNALPVPKNPGHNARPRAATTLIRMDLTTHATPEGPIRPTSSTRCAQPQPALIPIPSLLF